MLTAPAPWRGIGGLVRIAAYSFGSLQVSMVFRSRHTTSAYSLRGPALSCSPTALVLVGRSRIVRVFVVATGTVQSIILSSKFVRSCLDCIPIGVCGNTESLVTVRAAALEPGGTHSTQDEHPIVFGTLESYAAVLSHTAIPTMWLERSIVAMGAPIFYSGLCRDSNIEVLSAGRHKVISGLSFRPIASMPFSSMSSGTALIAVWWIQR